MDYKQKTGNFKGCSRISSNATDFISCPVPLLWSGNETSWEEFLAAKCHSYQLTFGASSGASAQLLSLFPVFHGGWRRTIKVENCLKSPASCLVVSFPASLVIVYFGQMTFQLMTRDSNDFLSRYFNKLLSVSWIRNKSHLLWPLKVQGKQLQAPSVV